MLSITLSIDAGDGPISKTVPCNDRMSAVDTVGALLVELLDLVDTNLVWRDNDVVLVSYPQHDSKPAKTYTYLRLDGEWSHTGVRHPITDARMAEMFAYGWVQLIAREGVPLNPPVTKENPWS